MESYLTVEVRDRPDGTVVAVSGELDMASSQQLDDAIAHVEPRGQRPVVIDLAELEFIDVTGLRSLLRAQERARTLGMRLTLVNVRAGVRKLLTITESTELLRSIEGT